MAAEVSEFLRHLEDGRGLSPHTVSAYRRDLEDLRVEEPAEIETGRTYYEFEVDKQEVDAFYQKRSLWLFLLANEGDERDERFVEDCFNYVAGCGGSHYTLTVVARNDDWTPELAGLAPGDDATA